jgi:hypothetical protein
LDEQVPAAPLHAWGILDWYLYLGKTEVEKCLEFILKDRSLDQEVAKIGAEVSS